MEVIPSGEDWGIFIQGTVTSPPPPRAPPLNRAREACSGGKGESAFPKGTIKNTTPW